MCDIMRLDRLLDFLGKGTRTQCAQLIRAGRVTVDGVVVRDAGARIDASRSALALSGRTLTYKRYRHVMLNKPAGVLTAARDKNARTVVDLLPALYRACECMPVGRLDKDTTGLLLFTSDGQLAHRILAPRREIDKVYVADVDGPLDRQDVAAFAAGLDLGDFTALPAKLEILASRADFASARVTVQEGKFHQVKRMFAARGRTVVRLERLRVGPITLDPALAPGQLRELTPEEEAALYQAVSADGCV